MPHGIVIVVVFYVKYSLILRYSTLLLHGYVLVHASWYCYCCCVLCEIFFNT